MGVDIDDLNENINHNTRLGVSLRNFTIGSKAVPLPIHLEVKPITIVLSEKCWRDNSWKEKGVSQKADNLKRALQDYPSITNARINPGKPLQ